VIPSEILRCDPRSPQNDGLFRFFAVIHAKLWMTRRWDSSPWFTLGSEWRLV